MIHYLESINRPINYTGAGGVVEGATFAKNPVAGVQVEMSVDKDFVTDVGEGAACTATSWGTTPNVSVSGGLASLVGSSAYLIALSMSQVCSGLANGDVVDITVDVADINGGTLEIYPSDNGQVMTVTTDGISTQQLTVDNVYRFGVYNVTNGTTVLLNSISVVITTPPTQDELVTATHIPIQTFPSELIGFEVPWTVDPVAGDVAEYRYDEVTGAYEDQNALDEFDQPIPLKSQTVALRNCKDPTAGITAFTVSAVGFNFVSLTWVEPIDVSLLSPYKLYRNGIYLQDVALGNTSLNDVGLNQNTNYAYRIDTIFNGNVISSSSVSVKTSIAPPVSEFAYSFDKQQLAINPSTILPTEINLTRF